MSAFHVPSMDVAGAMGILALHHVHLDRVFESLLSRDREGDARGLRDEWVCLQDDLDGHLDLEERILLPAFGREHREAARALRGEHDVIRASLTELGVALELNRVGAFSAQELITHIRGHAAREDSLLYPWAEGHLGGGAWSEIRTEIAAGVMPADDFEPTAAQRSADGETRGL